MILEQIEYDDWNITPENSPEERKLKSISAYYLQNWYEKVKNITFKTYIYSDKDEIPEVLPFSKSIVRYENKSPKDSDFWQPIATKTELLNLFHTSLRCKTNKGQYYCVREFKELGIEYRCFWNGGLVAISSEENVMPNFEEVISYINKIWNYIPYHRCVFDIAELKNDPNEKYILLEFNSWETNSGGHRFEWTETEIFYSLNNFKYVLDMNNQFAGTTSLYKSSFVTVAWQNKRNVLNNYNNHKIVCEQYVGSLTCAELFESFEIVEDFQYLNAIITDNYIYCSNDIWLGQFDKTTLKELNWTRGVFRFDEIHKCSNNMLKSGNNYYTSSLIPHKFNEYQTKPILLEKQNLHNEIKYGFMVKNKKSKQIFYLRMLSDCSFMLDMENVKYHIE